MLFFPSNLIPGGRIRKEFLRGLQSSPRAILVHGIVDLFGGYWGKDFLLCHLGGVVSKKSLTQSLLLQGMRIPNITPIDFIMGASYS